MKNQFTLVKKEAIISIIVLGMVILTPFLAITQNNFVILAETKKPADSALILFDNTDEITIKTALAMQGLLQSFIDIDCLAINNQRELQKAVKSQPENSLIIYAFHGNQNGLQIADNIYSWSILAYEVVKTTLAEYQLFLSCESSNLPSTGKSVFTQTGKRDFVVNIVNSVRYLADVMENNEFLQKMVSSILAEQTSLFLRMQYPQETLWLQDTHFKINEIAWNQLAQVNWIDYAITAGGYNFGILPNADPDYEENRLDINDLPAIANAINTNSIELQNTLQHVSFTIDIDLNLIVPEFYAADLNWQGNSLLEDVDNADGDLDGRIIYDTTLDAPSAYRNRIDYCIEKTNQFYPRATPPAYYNLGSWTSYEWAVWLTRASHYMQDQQNPFHTSLVDENDNVVEVLNIEANFNARARFIYHCSVATVPVWVSSFIFDNYADNILLGDYDLGFFIGIILALGLSTITNPLVAPGLLLAANSFMNELNSLMTTEMDKFNDIKTNSGTYNDMHEIYESYINTEMKNSNSILVTGITQYLSNNIDLVKSTAGNFIVESNRNNYLNTWIEDSRNDAQLIYNEMKNHQFSLSANAETIADRRLKQAAFQTAVLFEAYFIQSIWKTDSDNDGMSDYFEELIYNTPVNSGSHPYSYHLYEGSTYYRVYVDSATSNVPCFKIVIKAYNDKDASPVIKYYYNVQSITNQYLQVNRKDISTLTLQINYYDWEMQDDYTIGTSLVSYSVTYTFNSSPPPPPPPPPPTII